MARRARLFAPGLLYVIARGNHREPVFLADADYQAHLARLARYRLEHEVALLMSRIESLTPPRLVAIPPFPP